MPGLTAAGPTVKPAWKTDVDDYVIRMAFSPSGSLLATACVSGPIHLLDPDSGQIVRTLPGHAIGTQCLSWSHDGHYLASGGQDGRVRLWNPADGTLLHDLPAGSPWVEQVAFGPDCNLLVSAAGRCLKLWDTRGECLQTYPEHPSTISDVQWQHTARFFTTAAYGQLATFKPESSVAVKTFPWQGSILALAWSPNDNAVATGNQDASVHFWYRTSGKDLEMSGYPTKVRELSWDSGGRYLATGGSAIVTIWDCGGKGPAGSRPLQLDGHETLLTALEFQHRGGLIASGCRDGVVCIWNARKTAKLFSDTSVKSSVTQVRWAPRDQWLACSSANGIVRLYDAPANPER